MSRSSLPNSFALRWSLLAVSLLAASIDAADLEPAVTRPRVVRGGVLMLPLRSTVDRWPETATLSLEDGRRVDGRLAWIQAAPTEVPRRWTEECRGLAVRPIRPDDRLTVEVPGGPVLLARMPDDASGPIRLGGQTIDPVWLDASLPPNASVQPRLDVVPGLPDQPDADSPFAYWRWVLVAERFQQTPPDVRRYAGRHGEVGVMLAEHDAQIWLAALGRLDRLDVSLAERCRDLLTRVCMDGRQPFAAWVADPERISVLRSTLLDDHSSSKRTIEAVREWTATQREVLMWLEAEQPERVRLAMVNRGREPRVARFSWPGRDDVPIAVELTAGVLTAVDIDRPAPAAQESLRQSTLVEPDLLSIDMDGEVFRLPVAPRSVVARPPGVMQREMRAPLTLVEIETGDLRVTRDATTRVELRRRGGHWELFFDCRRREPRPATPMEWTPSNVELPLGSDAVTVLVGGDGEADAIRLTVPEHGGTRVWGRNDAALETHRRSYGDRWYARVVLPAAWLRLGAGETTLFGCARTFEGCGGFQVVPGAATPWRPTIGRVAADLGQWD